MNMTQAAKKLYITQPALSKHIQTMEQELGVELFVRNHNKITLTPAGEYLYEAFAKIQSDYNEAINMCRRIGGASRNQITIGFETGWNIANFIPHKSRLTEGLDPDVRISVHSYPVKDLMQAFKENQIDIIVTHTDNLKGLTGVRSVELGQVHDRLFFSCDHPLASRTDLKYEDFRDDVFFVLRDGNEEQNRRELSEVCGSYGFTPITEALPNFESLIGSVQSAAGVALLDNVHKLGANPRFDYLDTDFAESVTAAWKDAPGNEMLKAVATRISIAEDL